MRNNKIANFETAIQRLGRILSESWNLKVIFKGNECKTTGDVIYLPVLPDNAGDDLMDAMKGYLDHETGHVISTDFTAAKAITKGQNKLFTLSNALEDPRIERLMIERYPGTKAHLSYAHEWALKKLAQEKEEPDPNDSAKTIKSRPWDNLSNFGKVCMATTQLLSSDYDHWFIKEVVEPEILEIIKNHEHIFKEAVTAPNTGEVIEIAKKYLEALNEVEDPYIEPPGGGGGTEEGNVEPADGDPNNPLNSMFKKKRGGGRTANHVTRKITDVDDASLKEDEDTKDLGKQLEEEVQALRDSMDPKNMPYMVYSTESDKIIPIGDGDRIAYKRLMDQGRNAVAAIKQKMTGSLMAVKQSHWEGGKRRGKINPRALVKIAMGTSKNVFRQQIQSESFDTCAVIMVDHSGSMHSSKINLAAQTSIILGECFSQMNIPFGVFGFTTGDDSIANDRKSKASDADRELFSRWGELDIYSYKDFHELWVTNNHRLTRMPELHGGINTYDGESLRWGASKLMERKEKRKILFWLNDGMPQPNNSDDCAMHVEYTKKMAKMVESQIELVAVGIQTDAVKNFYKNWVCVNDLNTLPSVCVTKLDEILRKGKAQFSSAMRK